MNRYRILKIAGVMAGILLFSVVITTFLGVKRHETEDLQIVTSFYPMYVATLNITDGIDGVSVSSLAGPQSGCLHDYQLSPDNMIALSDADILVLNGAQAELFLRDVLDQLSHVTVVDTSHGVPLLESSDEHEHDHGHDHEDGDEVHEEAVNEHTWVSPVRYRQQIVTLTSELAKADKVHAAQYQANADAYLRQIDDIIKRFQSISATLPVKDCITFHDSLLYLADDLGLTPIGSLSIGEESGISAGELTKLEDALRASRGVLFLYDTDYGIGEYTYLQKQAPALHKTLELDTAITAGKNDKTAWVDAMNRNITSFEQAVQSLGGVSK